MALADKKYTRVFSTTGSDSDLVSGDKLTDLERKFNSKDYLSDPVQFDRLSPVLWQMQKMQEELDELRRFTNIELAHKDGKNYQVYHQSFIDDLGTTKHYLPWKDINEQTTIYQEEVAMVAPADGRIVSVTMRMSATAYDGVRTIGIHTIGPNASQFSSNSWTAEETESLPVTRDDDNHVFHFAFSNAKHFESGELVTISVQDDRDLHSSHRYCYVSTLVEWDYSTFLGSTSLETDAAI